MATSTIGTLSAETGCNIETIRYYERIRLLPKPPRSAGGHRLYGDDHVRRLTFIRRSRELGFTLKDVKSLLAFVDTGDYRCAEVKALTLEQLATVRRKIADLRRLERALKEMAIKCDGGDVPGCPILEALRR